MTIEKIEKNIKTLLKSLDEDSFIYDFLRAYNLPKASITRLKKGDYNLAKNSGEILWKKKLFFVRTNDTDLLGVIDNAKNDAGVTSHKPRFLVVTNFKSLLAIDTKTDDTLDIELKDLARHFDFFLPWAGMEKTQLASESLADVKAAEKMGRLYDLILEDNPAEDEQAQHSLNLFLSRLLFCFFAEDTGIFNDDQFTNGIGSHTNEDGHDLQNYLKKLFTVLSINDRGDAPRYLQDFPYVNGGLFSEEYPVPSFTRKSRQIIIECGALNWKEINPDIFGSMIQAVVHNDQRGSMGMHYTSVVNIMKVIEPLFLNDLYEELDKASDNKKKLEKLLTRLRHIRIFDPACGSGNFLIIAYKELCKLEIETLKQLHGKQKSLNFMSNLKLTQFYGIELDDFAHETAKLSLWLAEHQMNLAFKEVFGSAKPTLPLQDGGHIVCGNATRLDWQEVCPKDEGAEIYILGNPPYKGSRVQDQSQKNDMSVAFSGIAKKYKDIDYVGCWFIKASCYINKNTQAALVSTSSICEGSQVTALWPYIFQMNIEISFAYKSFNWSNNARGNAGVTCSIIGMRKTSTSRSLLYENNVSRNVKNINAYLIDGDNIFINKSKKTISKISKMLAGNYTGHAQKLMLTDTEKKDLLTSNPESKGLIKRVMGSNELIKGISRWCLWISNKDKKFAESIPYIKDRIVKVKLAREKSKDKSANKLASRPHQFRDINETTEQSIVVPTVSSSRRDYVPIAFIGNDTIVTNKAMVLYDCETYLFAILSSRIHMVWVRAIAGRMRQDISYSSILCYNTFPFPKISITQQENLEDHVFQVLDERELHSEKTMAQLYDPDKMPDSLRKAHHEMDLAVEKCYRSKPFKNDEERLEYLFKLYEEMIAAEKKG